MQEWTSADWVAVIAALAAAIGGIIAALKGTEAAKKADTAAKVVAAMAAPGGPGLPPGASFGDVFRILAIVEGMRSELRAAARGDEVPVPMVRGLKIAGERCTLRNAVLEKE